MFMSVSRILSDHTQFYSAVMRELGFELNSKFCSLEQSWAGWIAPGQERPIFFIGLPYDRQPANAGNGGGFDQRPAGADRERARVIGPVEAVGRAGVASDARGRGTHHNVDLLLFLRQLLHGEPPPTRW